MVMMMMVMIMPAAVAVSYQFTHSLLLSLVHADTPYTSDKAVDKDVKRGIISCVYLDTDTNTWVTDGCSVSDANITTIACECDHLTDFSVLVTNDQNGDGVVDGSG